MTSTTTREAHRWIQRLARFGLACRGLVYLIMGLLAAGIVFGRPGPGADTRGAFEEIAHQPLGRLLVLAVAVGFASLGLLEAVIAATSGRSGLQRLAAAAKAVIYGGLGVLALAVVVHQAPSGGADQQTVDATATVMRASGGRLLVGAVGAGIGVGGLVLMVKGLRRSYDREIDLGLASPGVRRLVEFVGVAGMTARGAIFGLIGYFLIESAVSFDPAHAKGIDGVLKSIAHDPFGPLLLLAAAAGLASFGLFSLIEVKYARTD